jgi:acyl carrier protein
MRRKERLVAYIQEAVDPEFNPDQQRLMEILDSVSLLQFIMFIDQELGITLDLSGLGIEMFTTVDTVVQALEELSPESKEEG